MLVLTRKSDQEIIIGKDKEIIITVLKIYPDKVSIGIEAPKDTPIYRNELLLKDAEKPPISADELINLNLEKEMYDTP